MNRNPKPFPVALITMLAVALPHLVTLVASEPSSDSLREPSAWEWRFPQPTSLELHDIVYGDGQFVAVGDRGTVLTSNDGIKWSAISLGEEDLHAVAYGDGEFVAVGRGVVMISPDAVDWTPHTVTDQPLLYDIEFANGLWVAVGNGGYILSSPDAVNWTVRERLQTSVYRPPDGVRPLFVDS